MISLKKYPLLKINHSNLIPREETKIKINTRKNFIATKKNTLFYNDFYHELQYKILNGNKNNNGFSLEIIFHGLNFNAKRIKRQRPNYFIDVHKSEIFVFNEKASNSFKSRIFKRRLIFFSFNQQLIHKIYKKIIKLKMPNVYTGKGLFARNDRYKTKKGKIKR